METNRITTKVETHTPEDTLPYHALFDSIPEFAIATTDIAITSADTADIESYYTREALMRFVDFVLRDNQILSEYTLLDNGLISMRIAENALPQYVPNIPSDYGFIGGVARTVLEQILHPSRTIYPRDIDIVRVKPIDKDASEHDKLAARELDQWILNTYNPEDSAHSKRFTNGMDVITKHYFLSRDFTMNEVLLHGNTLLATPQAFVDLYRNVVRLCASQLEWDDYPPDKLVAKSLRFFAGLVTRNKNRYDEDSVQLDILTSQMAKIVTIRPFHIALQTHRAWQSGGIDAVAEYVNQLRLHNKLPIEVTTLSQFSDYITTEMKRQNNNFYLQFADTLDEAIYSQYFNDYDSENPYNGIKLQKPNSKKWSEGTH
jgi:hypothetical protein